MIIKTKAYAKINLCLKILDKLPNGYHNLSTVMQRISLFDDIKIEIKDTDSRNIKILCSDENISSEKNIAYKAADLFFSRSAINGDIEIYIKKNIPAQAGLGGGSSDAAAVFSVLNQYYNNIFTEKELIALAAKTGADVPFFVKNKSRALCEGIGEIITPIDTDDADTKKFHVLIVKPSYNISTKQAFEDFDNYKKSENPEKSNGFKNDFTTLAFSQNENLRDIYEIILKHGALKSELSGSGSSLFGIFNDYNTAENCKKTLKSRNDVEFCDIFEYI